MADAEPVMDEDEYEEEAPQQVIDYRDKTKRCCLAAGSCTLRWLIGGFSSDGQGHVRRPLGPRGKEQMMQVGG
eukprot:1753399-Rhodomonas_salina.1